MDQATLGCECAVTRFLICLWTHGGPCPITGTVTRIEIVFDEGQDTGPDFFGAAILDNIDVNGMLVGHGATDAD
jgi:hypothetical protein